MNTERVREWVCRVATVARRLQLDVGERCRWAARCVRRCERWKPEVGELALQGFRLLALDLAECRLLRLARQCLHCARVEVELALRATGCVASSASSVLGGTA